MEKYTLENLDCANCALEIEDAIKATPGVKSASIDFATSTLFVDTNDFTRVKQTVHNIRPKIQITSKHVTTKKNRSIIFKRSLFPLLFSGLIFVVGLLEYEWLTGTPYGIGAYMVFIPAYLISGWRVLHNAASNVTKGRVFDEHFLMSIATLGAIAIGELPEAVGVMIFYMMGELLQEFSIEQSRRSIQALLEIRPNQATLIRMGRQEIVKPEVLQVGDTIIVKPGEKVPLDGEVIRGSSFVDNSPLTGESIPKSVIPGEHVFAGAINKTALLTLKVLRCYSETSISKILDMVENATTRKAKTEKFITKFARIYSPLVVFGALGVAIIPPLIFNADFSEWIYRALVILVISCPCALVISIPLGYFGGIGGASRKGILVKGSNFLDILASIKVVVFDKTGTITKGNFEVIQVSPQNGFSKDELLKYAAQAESGSNHPIAHSIRNAFGKDASRTVFESREINGHGVEAIVDGQRLLAGNDPLLHLENIVHDLELCDADGSVVHIAVDGNHAGFLVIADELKEDAVFAIQALRSIGVERIYMLTGDRDETAKEIANKLGIDDYQANLLPEEKLAALEGILSHHGNQGKTAYIGDGINDAPSIARADVGIAMGALGSEAAIETADVVIMTDSLTKVAEAIGIGRKTKQIIRQNIAMALVIKGFFIILGMSGSATMWQAVFGDIGVAILAVLNATRALR